MNKITQERYTGTQYQFQNKTQHIKKEHRELLDSIVLHHGISKYLEFAGSPIPPIDVGTDSARLTLSSEALTLYARYLLDDTSPLAIVTATDVERMQVVSQLLKSKQGG